MRRPLSACAAIGLYAISTATVAQNMQAENADTRPNVVVLVVDDAGLTDFSAFGG